MDSTNIFRQSSKLYDLGGLPTGTTSETYKGGGAFFSAITKLQRGLREYSNLEPVSLSINNVLYLHIIFGFI